MSAVKEWGKQNADRYLQRAIPDELEKIRELSREMDVIWRSGDDDPQMKQWSRLSDTRSNVMSDAHSEFSSYLEDVNRQLVDDLREVIETAL